MIKCPRRVYAFNAGRCKGVERGGEAVRSMLMTFWPVLRFYGPFFSPSPQHYLRCGHWSSQSVRGLL